MAAAAVLAACALMPLGAADAAWAQDRVSIDAGASPLALGEGGLSSAIGRSIWIASDSTVDAHLRMRFELHRLEDASAVGASWAPPECAQAGWEAGGDGWWYMREPLAPQGRVEVATELTLDDAAGVYGRLQGSGTVHLREIATIEATGEEGAWEDPVRIEAASAADAASSWPKTGAGSGRNRALALAALAALAAYALLCRRREGRR